MKIVNIHGFREEFAIHCRTTVCYTVPFATALLYHQEKPRENLISKPTEFLFSIVCTLLHIAFYLKRRIICSKMNLKHRAEPTQNTTADLQLCGADFLPAMSHLTFKCQCSDCRHLPVAQTRGGTQCVKRHTENPDASCVTCKTSSGYSFRTSTIILSF